jgi:hypothetical protein
MLLNSPICCYWQGLFKVQMNLLKYQRGGEQRFEGTFKNGQQGGGQRFEGTLMMAAELGPSSLEYKNLGPTSDTMSCY